MMTMTQSFTRKSITALLCGSLSLGAASVLHAEELTPWGAVKGANADGSIPAYPDQGVPAPEGHKEGRGHYLDPFADEQPLYSVTPENMGQYEEYLTEGMKGLMKRFPSYRMDVYPTHRTQRYSDWEIEQVKLNAERSKLVHDGEGVENTYGPVPFPQPADGYELLWNHFNRPEPASLEYRAPSYLVDASGHRTLLAELYLQSNKLTQDTTRDSLDGDYKQKVRAKYLGPPAQSGRQVLWYYSQDYQKADQVFYVYTPGQRRVRIAPDFGYDTPASSYGGAIFYDEVSLFEGRPDRFNFEMVGKKEILVPYNNNRMNQVGLDPDEVFGKDHINPDYMRWEKHRVWVLEATLKEGARHVYSKRRFYIDEDTWAMLMVETYDHAGELYRVGMINPIFMYDKQANWTNSFVMYDLVKNNYVMANWLGGSKRNYLRPHDEVINKTLFVPDALRASGVR